MPASACARKSCWSGGEFSAATALVYANDTLFMQRFRPSPTTPSPMAAVRGPSYYQEWKKAWAGPGGATASDSI